MKVVAFVPIRLNSKRVANKNLKLLGNKPLMCYLLDTLVQVKNINEVYVFCSTDRILPLLPDKVKFVQRPISLDNDETLGSEIYDAFIRLVDADLYVLAHTTSPFIKHQTIENAVDKVLNSNYDSALSVEKMQTFAWYNGHPLNYSLSYIPRTQEIQPVFIETSAFFVFNKNTWVERKQRIGNKPFFAEVDKIEGVDIDNPEDFEFAQKIVSL